MKKVDFCSPCYRSTGEGEFFFSKSCYVPIHCRSVHKSKSSSWQMVHKRRWTCFSVTGSFLSSRAAVETVPCSFSTLHKSHPFRWWCSWTQILTVAQHQRHTQSVSQSVTAVSCSASSSFHIRRRWSIFLFRLAASAHLSAVVCLSHTTPVWMLAISLIAGPRFRTLPSTWNYLYIEEKGMLCLKPSNDSASLFSRPPERERASGEKAS